jgi:hypothetical protein
VSVDVDPIAGTRAYAHARKAALAQVIRGRHLRETTPAGPQSGSFDGGARATVPSRLPPMQAHDLWLIEVLRGERLAERRDTTF